jgi:uncharacterized damage-inducible protein DinB
MDNKWVDRKFQFDHLDGTYLNILERLEGTPLRLEAKLDGLSEEELTASPDGKWSIQVHLGHLLTLESLWLGRLDDMVMGKEELRAWETTNLETKEANFNEGHLPTILEDFSTMREGFCDALRLLEGECDTMSAFHPRLKAPLSLIEMAYFIAEHDDHHLAVMEKIKGSLS